MAVTIITKFSEVAGTIPDNLAPGELAIDTNLGRIWFKKKDGPSTALAQEVYIVTSATSGLSGQKGGFKWETDTKRLFMYDALGVWQQIGLSVTGGTISGHVDVDIDGFNYFRTGDDIGANEDGAGGVKGIETAGKLKVSGDLVCGGDLIVSGNTSLQACGVDTTLSVGQTLSVAGIATVGHVTRTGAGGYYYASSGTHANCAITISNANPTNDIGYDGDVWIKI